MFESLHRNAFPYKGWFSVEALPGNSSGNTLLSCSCNINSLLSAHVVLSFIAQNLKLDLFLTLKDDRGFVFSKERRLCSFSHWFIQQVFQWLPCDRDHQKIRIPNSKWIWVLNIRWTCENKTGCWKLMCTGVLCIWLIYI